MQQALSLHYYYPRFPCPKVLLSVREIPSREVAVVLQTLAGLVARQALQRRTQEMVWIPPPQPTYQRWLRMLLAHTGARLEEEHDIWQLVERYRVKGFVKGYVLYRMERSSRQVGELSAEMDISLNVATSLCSVLDAVAIDESLQQEAEQRGLRLLSDARGLSENQCFEKYRLHFNRRVMAIQDPKIIETRAEMVALRAYVASQPNALYERALQQLEPDSPILGWGTGGESQFTLPSTQWAHFQTATTFCFNLPVFSTEYISRTYPAEKLRPSRQPSLWELEWREDVHYVAFLMSDGDNVSWLMSHFVEDEYRSWWSNPHRGRFPMGWTFCYMDLAQLCPYALHYLFETATSNDDLVQMGGGYFYPDHFGEKRDEPARWLRLHGERIAQYMQLGRLRTLAFITQRWDSAEALRAYRTFAQVKPDLLGIFAIQYYPYPAGKGKVLWVANGRGEDIPVVSPRYAIWNNAGRENEGTPTMVAQWLNRRSREYVGNVEDRFSWVTVHCWSWFRRRMAGQPPESEDIDQSKGGQPETSRGLSPVQWCVEQLAPHVKVVTPTQMLLLLRLHKHPRQVLEQEIAALEIQCHNQEWLRRQLHAARRSLERGDYPAAFLAGKAIYQKMQKR